MSERDPLISGSNGYQSSENGNLLTDNIAIADDGSRGCMPVFLSELRCRNFGFCHPREDVFYSCQWDWPPFIFVGYRLIAASYATTVMTLSIIHSKESKLPYPWPCWLTNWSFTLLTAYLVVAAIISFTHSVRDGRCWRRHSLRSSAYSFLPDSSLSIPSNPLPIYIRLQWLLFDIACPAAIIVTVVFFGALYPQLNPQGGLSFENATVHLSNTILAVLEICLNAIPIRLLHALYVLIYGAAYTIFSVIFWAVDHDNVLYPNVLDWNDPGRTSAFVILLSTVGVSVLQLLFYSAYKLRLLIYKQIYGTSY